MALLTTAALLGVTGGLLYKEIKKKSKGHRPASIRRLQNTLLAIRNHRQSLQTYLAESPTQQAEEDEKSIAEAKELKNTLTIFTGSTAIAVTGSLLYPPLAILSIPGALYLLRDVYKNTAKTFFKGKRPGVDFLVGIFTTCMFWQGLYVVGHFYISLYLLNRYLVKRAKQESKKNIVDVFRISPATPGQ